jgi:hypothetical protein
MFGSAAPPGVDRYEEPAAWVALPAWQSCRALE